MAGSKTETEQADHRVLFWCCHRNLRRSWKSWAFKLLAVVGKHWAGESKFLTFKLNVLLKTYGGAGIAQSIQWLSYRLDDQRTRFISLKGLAVRFTENLTRWIPTALTPGQSGRGMKLYLYFPYVLISWCRNIRTKLSIYLCLEDVWVLRNRSTHS
jgi:hypothetical protein